MSDSEPSVRQRKPKGNESVPKDGPEPSEKPKKSKRTNYDEDDPWSPYIDVLRVLTFLFMASCGLSYLVTSGESWFWTMKNPPAYLRTDWWKTKIVCLP